MPVPRVSVVVSHYDRAAWLAEALASIAAQTFRDFEVLLVNDAGPDASVLADEFGARYVHRDENGGVAAVRNTGVIAARGELIAYLDDDDLWRPGHLQGLVDALDAAGPACGLAYGDAEVWLVARADGPPLDWPVRARRTLAVPFSREDLARDDFIVPGGMLHRRALYDAVGPFDEALFISDDWDWLLRAARATAFARFPEIVVTVRIVEGGGNLSSDFGQKRRAALREIERRHWTPPLEPKTFWEVAETYARRAGG
jgi:glycosyltransferase involved in cell wall biosynthesis